MTLSKMVWRGSLRASQHISCFLHHAYPAYHTFKALQSGKEEAQNKWITFWLVHSPLLLLERLPLNLTSLPGYHQFKLLLVLWLSLSRFDGATLLWSRWIQPLLLRHEKAIDAQLQRMCERSTELADQSSRAGLAQLKKWTAMLVVQASKQARLTHTHTPSSSTVTLTLIPATPMRSAVAATPSHVAAPAPATLELESTEQMPSLRPPDEAPLQPATQLDHATSSIDAADSPVSSSAALLESLRGAVEDGLVHAAATPAVQQLAGQALQHALMQQAHLLDDAENIDPAWQDRPAASTVDAATELQPREQEQQQPEQEQEQPQTHVSPALPAKRLDETLASPRAAAPAAVPVPDPPPRTALGDLDPAGSSNGEEADLLQSPRPAKLSFVHSRKARPRVSFATVE